MAKLLQRQSVTEDCRTFPELTANPLPMRLLGAPDLLRFHPTLGSALSTRAGAAQEFSTWAKALAKRWKHAQNLCAAHTSVLVKDDGGGTPIAARIRKAHGNVSATLKAHKQEYG